MYQRLILLLLSIITLTIADNNNNNNDDDDNQRCNTKINPVPVNKIVERFNSLLEKRGFIGQQLAIQKTRSMLVDLIELGKTMIKDKAIVLHYVGASGTGKSTLAEIVAESLFYDDDCPRLFSPFSDDLIVNQSIKLGICKRCGTIQNTYGVVVRALQSQLLTLDEEDGRKFIHSVMEALAKVLSNTQRKNNNNNSPYAVLILDDFNLCKGKCQQDFAKALTDKKYLTDNGKMIHLDHHVVIILTSDLSEEDLRLYPGIAMEDAKRLIYNKVKDCWGEDSLWADLPDLTIPLFPFNDAEIKQILKQTFDNFIQQINDNIDIYLHEQRKLVTGEVRWDGKVHISDSVYRVVIQELYLKIENINARAFTQNLQPKLYTALRTPNPIGERLIIQTIPKEGVADELSMLGKVSNSIWNTMMKNLKSSSPPSHKLNKKQIWTNDIELKIKLNSQQQCKMNNEQQDSNFNDENNNCSPELQFELNIINDD
jgi:hypothetical protein